MIFPLAMVCDLPAVNRLFSSVVMKAVTFSCTRKHRLRYFTLPSRRQNTFLFLERWSALEISPCNPYFLRILPVTSLNITCLSALFLVVVNVSLILAMRALWANNDLHTSGETDAFCSCRLVFDAGESDTCWFFDSLLLSFFRSLSTFRFCFSSRDLSFCTSLCSFEFFLLIFFLPDFFYLKLIKDIIYHLKTTHWN